MTAVYDMLLLVFLSLVHVMSCSAAPPKDFEKARRDMVESQIASRGIRDDRVLAAMGKVPRHLFVPEDYRGMSYADFPLAIGEGQTISQPYIVAFMTESLKLMPDDRVLEIGTGSGYQAAVLAEIVAEVCTVEIIESLGKRAETLLGELGYDNVHVRIGDGYEGWPEMAPFDAVIVTCAPEEVPAALVTQLKDGGRIIVPVGPVGAVQELVRGVKVGGKLETSDVLPVRFVPMVRGKEVTCVGDGSERSREPAVVGESAGTRRIEVVPHDPRWKEMFLSEAETVARLFGRHVVAVHHIGSTAVPGMSAKPVIDMLMEVSDIESVDAMNDLMSVRGYLPRGEFGIGGRRFFIKGTETARTHHLHVFGCGHGRIADHLAFRDYLIAHPGEAVEYGRLKHDLAIRHEYDIEGYMAGKNEYIGVLTKKALAWMRTSGREDAAACDDVSGDA